MSGGRNPHGATAKHDRAQTASRLANGASRLTLTSLLGALAIPTAAHALPTDPVEPDPQQVVVTATRQPVAAEDVPATVTVIDDQRIADELAMDIRDLVRFEPGITVPRQPARFGAALGATGRAGNEGFVIRGIGGNRVLIQIDGVRMPDGFAFGAQSAGRGDYVDIGLIKSVEILRGPASALYGSDGLAGAVSFVTADPADFLADGRTIGGLARAAYASADEQFAETAILAGRLGGGLSLMAAYTRRDFHELKNQGTNDVLGSLRTTSNPQDGHSNAALGRLVWEPGGGHKLRLTGEYIDTYLFTDVLSGRGPGLAGTIDLLQGRDTGERWRGTVDWSWAGEGTLEYARLAAYYQDAEDRQFTDEDRTPAADRERLNTFENRVYGLSGEARLGFGGDALAGRLTIGGDISWTHQQGLRDGVVPPFGETFPTRAFPETDYMLAGIFAAGELSFGPLTLYPALRFDAYDLSPEDDPLLPTFAGAASDGSRLSPKLGAVLKAADNIRLFANYAQGFKAPEPSQVNNFFENPGSGYRSIPNPDLKPENSESIEGGVRLFNAFASLDLTGFYSRYRDFIEQVETTGIPFPNPGAGQFWVYQWRNVGRVEVKGAEARLKLNDAATGLNASLAIAYATGDEIDGGVRTPLATIDPLTLVLGAGWRDPEGRFGVQASATHAARKEADRAAGLCGTAQCFRPEGATILDVTAFVAVTPAITLRGGVFNLTDTKYARWSDVRGLAATSPAIDAYTRPGRNGSVSVSVKF